MQLLLYLSIFLQAIMELYKGAQSKQLFLLEGFTIICNVRKAKRSIA
jgi:hypothetical protein